MPPALAISKTRDRVGECPVWSVAEQALYWVDIEGRKIHRFDWADKSQQSWTTPERVGCIALVADGRVVAAMESGVFEITRLQAPDISLKLLAPITHPQTNMRFNDGRCDRSGRFWVSTMCMDMSLAAQVGAVYCLDEAGLSAAKVDGLITPNGMAFSPDDKTMYLSDSHPSVQKIWAFDVDLETATLSRERDFVDMLPLPGRPDGAAVDTQGNYWICANDAGQIHCFNPQGALLSSISVPVSKPSMCAFGGPDLNVLFVTSIQPAAAVGKDSCLSGAVFSIELDVKGQVEPYFSCFPRGNLA
ncbi:MAG: SMP-30/gluconolactonase/LRE family protein [Burkholderiaceae bacterium]